LKADGTPCGCGVELLRVRHNKHQKYLLEDTMTPKQIASIISEDVNQTYDNYFTKTHIGLFSDIISRMFPIINENIIREMLGNILVEEGEQINDQAYDKLLTTIISKMSETLPRTKVPSDDQILSILIKVIEGITRGNVAIQRKYFPATKVHEIATAIAENYKNIISREPNWLSKMVKNLKASLYVGGAERAGGLAINRRPSHTPTRMQISASEPAI